MDNNESWFVKYICLASRNIIFISCHVYLVSTELPAIHLACTRICTFCVLFFWKQLAENSSMEGNYEK